jgi:TonB family protein
MRAALTFGLVLAGCAAPLEIPASAPTPIAARPDPTATDWERYCADAAAGPPEAAEYSPKFVRIPRIVREVLAAYPQQACLERREGDVVLSVYVASDGSVRRVKVVDSAGPDFDAAAVGALRRFAFSPACLATGKPAPVLITYRYKFRRGPGC